jgi:hypothetical protein
MVVRSLGRAGIVSLTGAVPTVEAIAHPAAVGGTETQAQDS